MTTTVTSDTRDGICRITLNRPEALNAMNVELVGDLARALEGAHADPGARVIVLTGAGKAFCAGADLKERAGTPDRATAEANVERIQRVTRAMVFGDKVVVGAINGWAVGGGFEWAIGCDLTLWAASAKAFFPEMDWGLFVTGGATAILPALIGPARTKEMMLLGKRYDAHELQRMGVAWRVVPDAELARATTQVAERIASLSPRAVRDLKAVLNRATYADVHTALELETEAAIRANLDPDTTTRVARFGA